MQDKVFQKIIEIVTPYVKNKAALEQVTAETSFLKDLQVSSSRLVDIVLAIEDTFGITVSDSEADKISTVGAAVSLVKSKSTAHSTASA